MPCLVDPATFLARSYLEIPPELRARHLTLLLASLVYGALGVLVGARRWPPDVWHERTGMDPLELGPLFLAGLVEWSDGGAGADLHVRRAGAYVDCGEA